MWSSISCNDNQRPLTYLLNKAGESERWPTRENVFPRRNPRLWRPTQEGGWGGCKLCLEHTLPLSQHLFLGCISITALDWNTQTHHEPNKNPFMQKLAWFWFRNLSQTVLVQHRFSAFWLRSKCSICSYQLNIWYGGHVPPSILNWFLQGDEVQELAPALSRVGLALQYRQDRPTSPLNNQRSSHCPFKFWPMRQNQNLSLPH